MNWGKENFFQINTLSLKTNLGLLVIGICLTLGFSYILSFTNQKMALLDSAVSVFSIIATVLTVLKYIDNWIYWWFINLLAIYLYYMQNMEFTAVLYASYLVISIYGFIEWRTKLKAVYD
jgi:nicotinamide mononucleotide transporter